MNKLYDYYGMKINLLSLAVMHSNEEQIDKLLADESFKAINEGVSPLYFIGYVAEGKINKEKREKVLRIFRKILNNDRFTNVNTVFYDGNYSCTLLNHLLYEHDPVFETCCIELINSPKYQLVDYPGNYGDNPNDLNTAIIKENRAVAKAIMDHPDFTKIDFSFGGPDFVKKCKKLYLFKDLMDEKSRQALELIMNEYVFRDYHECYNATDTNIAKKLTEAIQTIKPYVQDSFPFPPMSAACNITRTNNNMVIDIIKHPKFTGEMLSRHIEDIASCLTDEEAYNLFHQNKKIEGWSTEFYGELAYYLINHRKTGLLKALIENENICFSEQFYSYYKYFLKNAVKASVRRNGVLDCYGYSEDEANNICKIIDEKYKKQLANDQLDINEFIELTQEDYSILKSGLNFCYDLIYKNGNEVPEQEEADEAIRNILIYDEEKAKVGPFFNIFDRDKVWELFTKYQSFEEIRKMLSTSVDETRKF